jgi:hypothetical protein
MEPPVLAEVGIAEGCSRLINGFGILKVAWPRAIAGARRTLEAARQATRRRLM